MASGFVRRRGRVSAGLEVGEIRLLDQLFADVETLLDDGAATGRDVLAAELGLADPEIDDDAARPSDPAVARLLPDGSRDDPAAAADFRRYTARGLRRRKVDGLRRVRRSLELAAQQHDGGDAAVRVQLDGEQAQAWVVALTDLRLVLADRLGIRTDADADELHARVAGGALEDDEADDETDDEAGDETSDQTGDQTGPGAWLAGVYDFVSWLQESLTEVLLAALPDRGDGRRPPPPGT